MVRAEYHNKKMIKSIWNNLLHQIFTVTLKTPRYLTFRVGLSGLDSLGVVVNNTGGLIAAGSGSKRDFGLYNLPFFASTKIIY